MKKSRLALVAILFAALGTVFYSCASDEVTDGVDPAIQKGIDAWNRKGTEQAFAQWSYIEDEKVQKKYLSYIDTYKAGIAALEAAEATKQESKILTSCNTAISKFNSLDPALEIEGWVIDKGIELTAPRFNKLLEGERIAEAEKLRSSAIKVYGNDAAFDSAKKEIDTVKTIIAKRTSLKDKIAELDEIEDVDKKIDAYNDFVAKVPGMKSEVAAIVAKSGAESAVKNVQKTYNTMAQNVEVQRTAAIREKAYEYKEQIGEIFANTTLQEGSGTGKNGALTKYDIRDHYEKVSKDMEAAYSQLLAFQQKYPAEISTDITNDIKAQKNDLNQKIAQIKNEIAHDEEVASRGSTVMPLMIGLFNPASGDTSKSRPAKFSGTAKSNTYWWGMVSIPKNQMNDLVITMKGDNKVRVFNANTKSGKLIGKNGIEDLVNLDKKMGKSWPVINAGAKLTGTNYYFEIQPGSSQNYSGEVVVYKAFMTRSR